MIYRRFIRAIVATMAASSIAIAALPKLARAATTLKEGEAREWVIWPTYSPSFNFNNQQVLGDEYLLNAQPGDTLEISVKVGGGTLSPILALFSVQTGQQVAFDDRFNSLAYQVPTTAQAGQYRLLVLAKNSTQGIYTLSMARKSQPATPNPTISVQDPVDGDPRRKILAEEFGLKVLGTCPESRTNLVVATFRESDAQYLYCANPNRFLKAGAYNYNAATGELDPATKPPEPCTLVIGGVCIIR